MAVIAPLRVALVSGPMYDPLYGLLPQFERQTGLRIEIAFQGHHPALNEHLSHVYAAGTADYDLISTHSKYAPSQRPWLRPLDDLVRLEELADFVPDTVALARIDGDLCGLPRNIDVRLLYYRRDLFEDRGEQAAFQESFGRELSVPATWEELRQVAHFLAHPPVLFGFVYPGRYSGLFGGFFELVAAAGGRLFNDDLTAAFVNEAGRWALGYLRALYLEDESCPPELPEMHYDECRELFIAGRVAMATDWPGGFHSIADPAHSAVADRFEVAVYPAGPAGRFVYSGGHTFAIPTSVRNLEGAVELLRFLSSPEAQYHEARHGAIPVRASVQQRIRAQAEPGSLPSRRVALLEETIANYMLIPPKFPQYPAVEDALWTSLQAGIVGKLTVEEALEQAAEEMGRMLRIH